MRISIFGPEGVWVGQGVIGESGQITDCPARLGEDEEETEKLYCAIEQSIEQGFTSGAVAKYEWFIHQGEEDEA